MGKKERLKQVIQDEANVLSEMSKKIDYDILCQIAEIMEEVKKKGHKVILAGCGTAGTAAKRIAHTMCVVEIPALFLSPADSVHGGMGVMQEGDVLILISKSGNTGEILNYIPAAKKKGMTIIGVTESSDSKLGKAADVCLKITVEKEPDCWGIISSASTLAFVSAFDAVTFLVMEMTNYTKEEFYLIHTGGGVGDILREEGVTW